MPVPVSGTSISTYSLKAVRSASTGGNFSGGWGSVQGVWTRRNIPDRDIVRSSFRIGGRVNLTSGLRANLETSYDWSLKVLRHMRAGIEYNVQCCGFLFHYNRYNVGGHRNDKNFRF